MGDVYAKTAKTGFNASYDWIILLSDIGKLVQAWHLVENFDACS